MSKPPDLNEELKARAHFYPDALKLMKKYVKKREKMDKPPFSGEWERYKFYHPNTVKTKIDFEQRQNSLRTFADGIVNMDMYPTIMFEWRSYGNTIPEAEVRAREIVNGAEPTWQECIRYEAYYIMGFAWVHPEGKPMPESSSVTTLYLDKDGRCREPSLDELPENERWWKEAKQVTLKCDWCGKDTGSMSKGVCTECARDAGIGGDYEADGNSDARIAQGLDQSALAINYGHKQGWF